jgi:hypothetical protein
MDLDITLDLVKIFPSSCATQDITELKAKLSEIKYYGQELADPNKPEGEDNVNLVLHIRDEIYRMPSLGTGIYQLLSINDAKNTIEQFEENKNVVKTDWENSMYQAAKKVYGIFKQKYC